MSRRPGRVYFIEAIGLDLVKIGWTAGEVRTRLKALQCASPVELQVCGAMHGTLYQERGFHRRYRALRVRGEWFRLSPELLTFIRENASCGLLMGSSSASPGQNTADSTPPDSEKE